MVSNAKLQAQADMRRLVSKIEEYRKNLSTAEKQEFDGENAFYASIYSFVQIPNHIFCYFSIPLQPSGAWTGRATSARTRSCAAGCTP
jgi:hypothetical protein